MKKKERNPEDGVIFVSTLPDDKPVVKIILGKTAQPIE